MKAKELMAGHVRIHRILPLAVIAAVFATICDAIHAYTGTLSYSDPMLFGKPWSVFPSFLVVFVIMMLLYDRLFTRLPESISKSISTSKGNLRTCVDSFLIFVLIYMMSGFGHESPLLLNIIFYAAFLVRLAASYERTFILIFAIVLAISGMAGEGFLVVGGLVEYKYPDIFHVPWWLGGVYLHGALALREMMRCFAYRDDSN